MILTKFSFFTNYLIGILNSHLLKISVGSDNYYRLNINSRSLSFVIKILSLDSHLRYKNLSDISCVDFLGKLKRFQMNYILLSLDYNSRIILSIDLEQNEIVESLSNIFNGSN
jgi:NADH-quinone oxidoreductase subunit C